MSCPICATSTPVTAGVARCGACGFTFQHPSPTAADIATTYRDAPYWWQHDGHGREHRFSQALELIEARQDVGRLLDVGCGVGGMLAVASARGWNVCGLDVNPRSVQRVQSLGFEARAGTIRDIADETFDAISYIDSFEYVPDPLAELHAATCALRPNGVLVVATPNVDWHRRVAVVRRRHGFRFVGSPPETRVVAFTPRSLTLALKRCGFSDVLTTGAAERGIRRIARVGAVSAFTPSFVAVATADPVTRE